MKVSIILATYNREKLLPRCLDSIINQTYKNIELIVVDDGSTDNTSKLFVNSYTDSRIKYHTLEKNMGATAARNIGLDFASGEAVLVWDSDDVLYPNAIQRGVQLLQTNEDVGVVSAQTKFLKKGKHVHFFHRPSGLVTWDEKLQGKLPPDTAFILVRADVLAGVYFEARNIDFVWVDRLFSKCNWYHLDEYLGDIYLVSDHNSLTLQRKKTDITKTIERGPALESYVLEFKNKFIEASPVHMANCAYGASLGLLLSWRWLRAVKMAAIAMKYTDKLKHKLFFVFVVVPFSPLLLHILFRLRVFFAKQ